MEDKEILDFLRQRCVGFSALCGLQYDAASVGKCSMSLHLEEQHLNPQGTAHGGLIATLMDVTAGSVGFFAHGKLRPVMTQSCSIQYLRPVRGPRVYAAAECVKAGRRSAVVRCDLWDESPEKLCATGTFELCYLDI